MWIGARVCSSKLQRDMEPFVQLTVPFYEIKRTWVKTDDVEDQGS